MGGSAIQCNRQSTREMKKRVQVEWSGWRWMSGVICDRRAAGIKGRFYKMVVRPARIYGLKILELKVLELKIFFGRD